MKNERGNAPANEQTIREHFAALALQGLCASGKWCVNDVIGHKCAEWSVMAADALLAELAKAKP